MADIAHFAHTLDEAQRHAEACRQFSEKHKLSAEDAYAVQSALIGRRLARGETRVGMKMGFTSRAKMVQMGISDMIWGRLTSGMVIEDGSTISRKQYVHPRAEPEIAFLLGRPLGWPVTAAEAYAAVEAVAPAIEIIDSRYKDFKFDLGDVIADNASSSSFVVGPWQSKDVDLANLGMIFEINGRPRQIGSSAAILGHPVRSLVAAARLSANAGEPLQTGWTIMAGGATAAEALAVGDYVRNVVQNLGSVAFSVGE
jgi:2-oxo-3-hexenedioate decarboxylase